MAGGGIKINNISVSGGADGKTPVFKIENGKLFNSYDNGITWYELGQVKGADGNNGVDGKNGAKLVSQILQGQDEQGGNIYKQTFDDGTIAFFVAPKGEKGEQGESFNGVTVDTTQVVTGQKYFTKPVIAKSDTGEASYGANKITLVNNEMGSDDYGLYFPYPIFREATLATVEEIEQGQIIPYVSSKALRDEYDNYIVDTYATKTEVGKNTQGIKMLKNIFLQTEVIASAEIDGAFTTRVTANGQKIVDEQETQVLEIKGDTARCENLVPYPYAAKTGTFGGVDITVNDDYSITLNGTCTTDTSFPFYNAGYTTGVGFPISDGKYTLSGCVGGSDTNNYYMQIYVNNSQRGVQRTKPLTFTVSSGVNLVNRIVMFIKVGAMFNNLTIYPMLNAGETARPYQPYFSDLKHAYFSGIKSTNADGDKEDIYELAEPIELPKYDSFNPQTGEITRATKRIVFTGEENWITTDTHNSYNGIADEYRNRLFGLVLSTNSNVSVAHGISNLYRTLDSSANYMNNKSVVVRNNFVDIYDPEYNTSDISLWKAHLAELYANGTPLIVEYELATPTIETVENAPKSYTAYNQGTETVVQGETDNSVYGALPSVKNDYLVIVGGEEDEI